MIDINDIQTQVASELSGKRNEVILSRLAKIVGIYVATYEELIKYHIDRLRLIREGNTETVYWNDGSRGVIRIVTFVMGAPVLHQEGLTAKLTTEISYY